MLVPLLLLQWIAEIVFSLSVHHNGFLYYQGGDQIWYYTTGWLSGHGVIPKTLISPAWSFLLAPFALVIGPGYVSALPVGDPDRGAGPRPRSRSSASTTSARGSPGRAIGYVAAGLWVFGPYLAIPLFKQDYHSKYVDQFLPAPARPDDDGRLPERRLPARGGALMVRTYQTRRVEWAIAAGLVTGLAVLTKASNLIFLATPVVLFLIGRRWRELGTFALAVRAGARRARALEVPRLRDAAGLRQRLPGAAARPRRHRRRLHAVPQVREHRLVAPAEQPRRTGRGVLLVCASSSSCPSRARSRSRAGRGRSRSRSRRGSGSTS